MIKTLLKKNRKKEKKKFELIKGEFSPEDAFKILGHLIHEKISYHNLRSFREFERLGKKDEWSETRIEELKQSRDKIRAIIDNAKDQGKVLSIKSNISLELK